MLLSQKDAELQTNVDTTKFYNTSHLVQVLAQIWLMARTLKCLKVCFMYMEVDESRKEESNRTVLAHPGDTWDGNCEAYTYTPFVMF